MQYRNFGKTNEKVSALGFGLMRLPVIDGDNSKIDQDATTRLIHQAIEGGVTYFDTAYVYHDQTSETALGIALQGGLRDKVMIATKLPLWMLNETADFDRYLDEQLKRLQTDHIDFYLMHSFDSVTWPKTKKLHLLDRAEAALANGRIRHLGFSFHDTLDVFKDILNGYDKWEFCQIQYNYVDYDFQAGNTGLKMAADKGLGVVIMEPLRGGRLANDIPALRPIWNNAEVKRSPAAWSLSWLWNQPEVSVILSGMNTSEQLAENMATASSSLPGSMSTRDLEVVADAAKTIKGLSPIPCTACRYCMPCPNDVDIPGNFAIYNDARMFDDLGKSKFEYRNWIRDENKASQCIECGECLSKCPQHIEISSWMPHVAEVLGQDKPYVTSL